MGKPGGLKMLGGRGKNFLGEGGGRDPLRQYVSFHMLLGNNPLRQHVPLQMLLKDRVKFW